MNEDVKISLSHNEALVLFEFFARYQETEHFAFAHVSEFIALSKIIGSLERELAEPFSSEYLMLLKAAQESVAADCDFGDGYPGPKVDQT